MHIIWCGISVDHHKHPPTPCDLLVYYHPPNVSFLLKFFDHIPYTHILKFTYLLMHILCAVSVEHQHPCTITPPPRLRTLVYYHSQKLRRRHMKTPHINMFFKLALYQTPQLALGNNNWYTRRKNQPCRDAQKRKDWTKIHQKGAYIYLWSIVTQRTHTNQTKDTTYATHARFVS